MKVWITPEELWPVYMLSPEEEKFAVAAGDVPNELFDRFEAAKREFDAVQDEINLILDEAYDDHDKREEAEELVANCERQQALVKNGCWHTVP